MRPERCGMLISCPPWSFSVGSAYVSIHYFFLPRTQALRQVKWLVTRINAVGFFLLGAGHCNRIWKVFHQTRTSFSLKQYPFLSLKHECLSACECKRQRQAINPFESCASIYSYITVIPKQKMLIYQLKHLGKDFRHFKLILLLPEHPLDKISWIWIIDP